MWCIRNYNSSNLVVYWILDFDRCSFELGILLLPMFQVGLNNIKETDFVNVTIQSLMRVTPLRNFFLIPENYQNCKSPLVHRYGELTRKIWHARNFKGQVFSLWFILFLTINIRACICFCLCFLPFKSERLLIHRWVLMSFYRQLWKPVKSDSVSVFSLIQLSSCLGYLIRYMQILRAQQETIGTSFTNAFRFWISSMYLCSCFRSHSLGRGQSPADFHW